MRRHQHEARERTIRKAVILAAAVAAVATGRATPHDQTTTRAAASRPGPVEPETAVTRFKLPDDLAIELVAAEPDVVDPVAIAFDADGRLWVVEMSDYPNGPPENGPPLSRVRVLSDPDGDGRYGNPETFADKLVFANGLLLWNGGLLVTTDGEALFLRDTDGDGRADEREVWFTGFKRENPQLRANHPTLGLDNHIYIASGLRGGEVIAARSDWAKNAKPVSLSGRDFRFDPFTGESEAVSGVGQFGLCFDDFGNRFVCSNRNPCNHIVLEDRYLARNPQLAISQVHEDVSPAAELSRLFPISRIWTTSNLHANQFTAACGVLIYRGEALPQQYRGNSFTCEPTSNLIHRDVLVPHGATFTSRPGRDGVEFLATRDEWFRPVNLTHGPDGALYLVDMYRAVIEHPEFMPVELKARPDLTDGSDRGRIYRIVPRTKRRISDGAVLNLSQATSEELVTRLSSSNPWVRDTAARLVLERRNGSITAELATLAREGATPATRVQALWLLHGIGGLSREIVAAALDDPNARVREHALLLAEQRFAEEGTFRDRCLEFLADPNHDARLRFQAALSLGSFPATEAAAPALAKLAAQSPGDRWMRAAVAASAVATMPDVLAQVITLWEAEAASPKAPQPSIADQVTLIVQFAEMAASGGQHEHAATLFTNLSEVIAKNLADDGSSQRRALALLRGVARGLRRSGIRFDQFVASLDESSIAATNSVFGIARSIAADASRTVDIRVEAIELFAEAPAEEALSVLPPLTGSNEQAVALAAIDALARQGDATVGPVLLRGFRQRTPRLRNAILAAMSTPDRMRLLLDEIEAGRISPRDIDLSISQRLARLTDPELKTRAEKLLASQADPNRQEIVSRYQTSLTVPHDLERGRAVFSQNCATCHRVGDVGVNVGADISDTRTSTPEQLLVNILDPNKAVDGNYFGYSLIDTQGRAYTGIVIAETTSSVTLRQPEAKEVTILRRDIEELASTGLSLMPVGLEKNIDEQQMSDLIGFLKNWRYVDGAVPRAVLEDPHQ